jgi:DNA-directed RNA polymerase specialized sigma24 family protein
MLPEPAAADCVRRTFERARADLRAGERVDRLGPWLHRLARDAAVGAAGEAGYDYAELERALDMRPAPDEDLERRAVIRETLASVAALPAERRDALLRTGRRVPGP